MEVDISETWPFSNYPFLPPFLFLSYPTSSLLLFIPFIFPPSFPFLLFLLSINKFLPQSFYGMRQGIHRESAHHVQQGLWLLCARHLDRITALISETEETSQTILPNSPILQTKKGNSLGVLDEHLKVYLATMLDFPQQWQTPFYSILLRQEGLDLPVHVPVEPLKCAKS